jgi:hypothetical protein
MFIISYIKSGSQKASYAYHLKNLELFGQHENHPQSLLITGIAKSGEKFANHTPSTAIF